MTCKNHINYVKIRDQYIFEEMHFSKQISAPVYGVLGVPIKRIIPKPDAYAVPSYSYGHCAIKL